MPPRSGLESLTTGVTVVTALENGVPTGMTIQWASAVSNDPPIILISPSLSSTTWPRIESAGALCINVLAEGQEEVARRFASAAVNRFAGIGWTPAPISGSPVLDGVVAWFDCGIDRFARTGDHWTVACAVKSMSSTTDRAPLVYFNREFARIRVQE